MASDFYYKNQIQISQGPMNRDNTIDMAAFGVVVLISLPLPRGISADIIVFCQVTLHLANPSASPGELFLLSYVIDFRSKRLQQFMNKETPGVRVLLAVINLPSTLRTTLQEINPSSDARFHSILSAILNDVTRLMREMISNRLNHNG